MGASPTLSQLLSRAESSPCGGRSSGGLSSTQLAPAVATHTPSLHLQEVWLLLLQPFLWLVADACRVQHTTDSFVQL